MTVTLRSLPIILAIAALASGCASTSHKGSSKTREINNDHVTSVERVAKSSGVRVVWINPPTRVRERRLEYSMEVELEPDQ